MKAVDGRSIQRRIFNQIKEEVKGWSRPPILNIVYVGFDPVIEKYVSLKQRYAGDVGIQVDLHKLEETVSTKEVLDLIEELNEKDGSAMIIQLPLPSSIDRESVLEKINPEKDADVLSNEAFNRFSRGELLWDQPVAGSVKEILGEYKIDLSGKKIAVVGNGKLVGQPVFSLFKSQKQSPVIFDKDSNLSDLINFDVVISGVGRPGLIKPEYISEGAILLDAGTSTDGGSISGDIDPECYSKSSLYTPVPGGVGPITLAKLFHNVVNIVR